MVSATIWDNVYCICLALFRIKQSQIQVKVPYQRWDDHPQIQGVDGPPSGRSSPSAHARDHPDLRLAGDFYNVHLGDRGFFGATKTHTQKKNECYKVGPKSPVILASY